jgi:hypothetical protein
MYTYINSEPGLWTVGFQRNGKWNPESDHTSPHDAHMRAVWLNGETSTYVYITSEPSLWTVGYFYNGRFCPMSDHRNQIQAAKETSRLNINTQH